ncbi:hypothetical protein BGZ99_008389 [Dissophora globulifera]|uniref:PUM-HD domain-containing protein n=1 Tax=Dissophora globulifera TaxID=979702 RepID=A0A9P6RBX4_9FUNG|nr:hypothetical protein BGZ99_008389 [Dissophora globulifera]
MLGNGYKERLSNAQSNIDSLLLNLAKQQQQQHPLVSEDNEPSMLDSPFKHSFATKLMNAPSSVGGSNALSLPPAPAPVLESNSSSRATFQKQQTQPQQQQQQQPNRVSRLPSASLNLGRIADQFPEVGLLEPSSSSSSVGNAFERRGSRSNIDDFSTACEPQQLHQLQHLRHSQYESSVFGSGGMGFHWDTLSNSLLRGNNNNANSTAFTGSTRSSSNTPMSSSPSLESRSVADAQFLASGSGHSASSAISSGTMVNAVMVIQRTSDATGATFVVEKVDLESLQQTCLRQSAEINQLKELMTKMLLNAEEDRCKLRQRDREIEELMGMRPQQQQQKQQQTLSLTTNVTAGAASTIATIGAEQLHQQQQQTTGNVLGIPADDLYESNLSYACNAGGPPLASSASPSSSSSVSIRNLSSMPSRSDSIASIQSQQPLSHHHHHHHPNNLGLKINTSSSQSLIYQQQYHGLMDMVDSPLSSEYSLPDVAATSGGLTPTGSTGRGLVGAQHGYSSQPIFPLLSHRSSGSFSSSATTATRSAFDSPAVEQQGSYPWSVSGGLSHSQSWAEDMTGGYGYDSNVSSPVQFQHGGMGASTGYDPNFINQQYSHGGAPQQHHHQGLHTQRNSYRRHGDKPVHLDYQMCVDRILQATDQQASIHLQQKLKTSPPEQKIQIIDAILGQAYPLMSNRFGNFLIQRCFEFGSPQQIDALAQAMRGNILTLACDPFGCHVVQKAIDNVEEECKAKIVTEMFRRIRETIVHRYACHVWQKVFEIRWTDAPPAVMTYVNNAVAGKWAGVAIDETGSLVVQNIFENCAEHDKRPVLNEILQSVTTIAKGQWGNWVIQHILEHGAPGDRATVTQKILEDAVNLSLDQYASKVVEKTLRMAAFHSSASSSLVAAAVVSGSNLEKLNSNAQAGSEDLTEVNAPPTVTVNGTTIRLTQEEVMSQYIHIVCDGVQDRPRIPLIDIAADQYGNYIVQYILTNAGPQHRETCAVLIKRHMVSLRGSKYGQKVAFMVERWRGSPFAGNNNNNHGGSGNGSSLGGGSYGSKSGSGLEGGNGGNGGGRRQRW